MMERALAIALAVAFLVSGVPLFAAEAPERTSDPKVITGPHLAPPNPAVYPTPPYVQETSSWERVGTRASSVEKTVVLLIDFTDVQHDSSNTKPYFDQLLFDQSGGRSMYDYYSENSYGQFTFLGTTGARWYTSSQTMAYYGADSTTGVDDLTGPIYRLVEEAVQLADADIDFSQYDNDGDGKVDHVIVVHAGGGQESSVNDNNIWSHRWVVPDSENLIVDGVAVYNYIMLSEFSPLGVFAHEFGHDLGLPDLYEHGTQEGGIGVWGVMGGGSWLGTPPGAQPSHLSAWSKIQMGWVTPVVVDSPLKPADIPAVESQPVVYQLPIKSSPGGDEYFLVENRQPIGYDASLPGFGLIIWHVDESVPDNNDPTHKMVDVEEADERFGEDPTDDTDPWADSDEGFSPASDPDSNAYGNVRTGWKVRKISASAAVMTAEITKEVDYDLAVGDIAVESIVSVGDTVTLGVSVANRGVMDQTNIIVNLTVYLEEYDPAAIVHEDFKTRALLQSEAFWNFTWIVPSTVLPAFGSYIVLVTLPIDMDEIPEDNDLASHFNVNEFQFRDTVETGGGSWTVDPGDLEYRWQIVQDGDTYGESRSPTRSWRFGFFDGAVPNTQSVYYLESAAIDVTGLTEAYLIFWQLYDFSGKVESDPPSRRILRPIDTDTGYVELQTFDGATWSPWALLQRFDGAIPDWESVYIDLTSYVGGAVQSVRLRFGATYAVMSNEGGWWVDDVAIVLHELGYGLILRIYDSPQGVIPGEVADFRLKLTNVGDLSDTFTFSVTDLPAGWTFILSENSSLLGSTVLYLDLAPNEVGMVFLAVKVSQESKPGSEVNVTASAVSTGDPTKSMSVLATISVLEDPLVALLMKLIIVGLVLLIVFVPIILIINAVKRRRRMRGPRRRLPPPPPHY
jgi:M6 family metalloprotease-like protein